jgi:hypothetical protein
VNLHYKVELGVFTSEASMDDTAIILQSGPVRHELRWEQVYGAALVRQAKQPHEVPPGKKPDERAARLFDDPELVAKMHALKDKFQMVAFAYRDPRGHKKILEFPIPLDDSRYLQEIVARVGPRWLGEVSDHQQAEKKLGTAPGFFKLAFVLVAVLVGIALVAAFGFFAVLGPAFNFLSLQRMLLDLQDGEYASFGVRLLTYVALFVLAALIRRWWCRRMAERRARIPNSQLRS